MALVGQIRVFAGKFAPLDWKFCDGSLLSVSANPALFSLIGTIYGGDGVSTFALPDLRGRLPISKGQGPGQTTNYALGAKAGTETVTLQPAQIPSHNHSFSVANTPGSAQEPVPNGSTSSGPAAYYIPSDTPNVKTVQLLPTCVSSAGQNLPHNNLMPTMALNFIICINGEYPSFS